MINLNRHSKISKSIFAAILAIALITSTFAATALAFTPGQSYTSPDYADYVISEGTAANDYYSSRQYSYVINQWASEYGPLVGSTSEYPAANPNYDWFNANKAIRVGMTEFGEFATPENAGIAYGADNDEFDITESWASDLILEKYWIQGWTLSMNYMRQGEERSIHAWSIYSDLTNKEDGREVYSWYGDYCDYMVQGRQVTPGSLLPAGVDVIYDSARLFVARTHTIVRDGFFKEDVAKVTFTLVFNKDTKYAIAYKDVKVLLDSKILDRIINFTFTERYEIDLARGINPSNTAYIHYFDEFSETVYQHPLVGNNTYDVLQAFDGERNYIFFAGYWPSTTEHTVYNPLVPKETMVGAPCNHDGMRILPVGTAVSDMPVEPSTPWVIAQWQYDEEEYPKLLNFLAKADVNREIRFVEVFGMTDYNKGSEIVSDNSEPQIRAIYNPYAPFVAQDINATDAINFVDVEVQYLMHQVFNPEDLTTVGNVGDDPFMWMGLGQSSATSDSAGAVMLTDIAGSAEPLSLFDKHDDLFPWTEDDLNEGTIPFGLEVFDGSYTEVFSNTERGTGADSTEYVRTGLLDFVFWAYDDEWQSPPQPIAGGDSYLGDYWYPSKNPLTERWTGWWYTYNDLIGYDAITYNPNGILSVGGVKANGLTRYFNDYNFAITREGTSPAASIYDLHTFGLLIDAPTSDPSLPTYDFFPVSTWASSYNEFGYSEGYAVISIARDINGTRGLSVYGWDGRDTYWASAWASQYLDQDYNQWVPAGATAIILNIEYTDEFHEPSGFEVVKVLGTITEFGTNLFWKTYAGGAYDQNDNLWNEDPSSPTWDTGDSDFTLPDLNEDIERVECEYKVWWFAKLPTKTTAKVQFDP